jgi:hypothetical protein
MISAYFELARQARDFSDRYRETSIFSPEAAGFAKKEDRGFIGSGASPTRQERTADGTLRTRQKILSYYESARPGTKADLGRILLRGKLHQAKD